MRSLFFKIFLWFWLASLLVAGVFILSGAWGFHDPPPPNPFKELMDQALANYGRQAADAYEREGAPALRKFLEHLHRTTKIQIALVTQGEKDVLGAALPADAREMLDRAACNPMPQISRPRTPFMMAQSIRSSKGNSYLILIKMPFGPMEKFFSRPRILILRAAAVILMAGIVCYGLARYLTFPLRRLRQTARQLAEGDLSVRTGTILDRRHDEIGDLGRDFNFMAERLESLMTGQRRLLRDISHELRSPLTRLNVALELARQRAGSDAGGTLDRIELEVSRLNELIGRLLTLARLENQWKEDDKVDIDLSDLMHQIADDADFEAKSRSRKVQLRVYGQATISGVPGLLRSAIENVVRNAIYYTEENTLVDVIMHLTMKDNNPFALIRISDRGPGVPAEDLAKIFRPFYRVADARDRYTGGVGLGLAITERAVRLHGGQISASNAPEGGLVVEILLPVKRQPYQASNGHSQMEENP